MILVNLKVSTNLKFTSADIVKKFKVKFLLWVSRKTLRYEPFYETFLIPMHNYTVAFPFYKDAQK